MANTPTIIKGQLTFVGAITGQVSVQAQPVAGNNLLFNLPNTVPNPNQVISVVSVVGSTVTLGFTPPFPTTWSFSQITGTIATSQLASREGNGSKVQTTNQGLTVAGDVVTYDGSGNIQDSGVALALLLAGAAPSPVTPHLGSAAQYALLGTTITNSDGAGTVISGGNINGTTITPAGWTLTPPTSVSSPVSSQALTDLNTAITYFGGLTSTAITTADLGTQGNGSAANVFNAGVYKSGSSINIATSIVLDGQDNPNAMFVFIATASTVTQESGTSITLINGAQAANVVWVVGSSWTSITPSTTVGNILAVASITLGGGTLQGRALAAAAITLAAAGTIVSAPPAAPPMAQTFTPVVGGSPAGPIEFLTGYNATTGLFSAATPPYPVASVNGQTGVVVLTAGSVGADASGAAAAAQSAAQAFATAADTTVLTTAEAFATTGDGTTLTAAEAFATAAVLVETDRAEAVEATIAASVPVLYDGAGNPAAEASGSPASNGDNHIASGAATLVVDGSPPNSSVTVTMTGASAFANNYYVYLTYLGVPINPGHLYYIPISGSSFTIYSDNGADVSTVAWTAVGY